MAPTKTIRPSVMLGDGNAFAIIGACRRSARRAGWSVEEIAAFTDEATDGDYRHLLSTVDRYFDVGSE